MNKRRNFITSIFGILGLVPFIKQEDYYNPTEKLRNRKFITLAEKDGSIKSITIDGKEVIDECFCCFVDSDIDDNGSVWLYKRNKVGKFYMRHLNDGTPMKKDEDAEFGYVNYKGKKIIVQTNPIKIAEEMVRGKVVITRKI